MKLPGKMTAPRLIQDKTFREWSLVSGVKPNTIRMRLDAWGWTVEEAVGLVPHESLRGKCRGKPVTIAYKKALDKGQRMNDNPIKLENIKWF